MYSILDYLRFLPGRNALDRALIIRLLFLEYTCVPFYIRWLFATINMALLAPEILSHHKNAIAVLPSSLNFHP